MTQIDVPFSFLLDTILLPVSIPAAGHQRKLKSSAASRLVLVQTLYVSGGDAPRAQSLIVFDGGYVRLRNTGSTPVWRKMSHSDWQRLKAVVSSTEFSAQVADLPRRFACCDTPEVAIVLGGKNDDVDKVVNPPSVPTSTIGAVAPSVRHFLQLRDELGTKLFGRTYLRLQRPTA
jgi:hypothetical protein